jgi:CBS domain containing-hemolysin-like protein
MPLEIALLIAVALLIGNAFFVGSEFALITARRTQIEPRVARGSRRARTTLRAMEQVSPMIAGAQLGITACSIGLGAVAEPAIAQALEPGFAALGVPTSLVHPVAIVLALLIVVSLHMVLGEMVPKNIAIASPERSALLLGPPLFAIVSALKPVIWLLNGIANGVLRLLRVPVRAEVATTFTRDEVAGLVEESRREGLLDAAEHGLLTGALEFSDEQIGSIAMPLHEVLTAPQSASPRDLEQLCVTTGFSRFPIRGEQGVIVGYVHVKDLLSVSEHRFDEPVQQRWIRIMPVVSGEAQLQTVLSIMQRRGTHMVRVVDAKSQQLIGIAMLQDVLAQLVGDVAA